MATTIAIAIAPVDFYESEEKSEVMNIDEHLLGKCGEVFLRPRFHDELFIFYCSLCSNKFSTLASFTRHVQKEHLVIGAVDEEENQSDSIIESNEDKVDAKEIATVIMEAKEKSLSMHGKNDEVIATMDHLKSCDDAKTKMTIEDNEKWRPMTRENARNEDGIVSRTHQCTTCSKTFRRKSNLKIHQMSHERVKPFTCNQCNATFVSKQNLIIHVRRHVGDKPFKCDYCDKAFVCSTERNSHHRSHTGERPFVCDECGKSHTTSSQLREHMRLHGDEQHYQCTDCDKSFRQLSYLRAHSKTVHTTTTRSHRCSDCNASFKTAAAVRQHAKIHALHKAYRCHLCGKTFAQHPGLYLHIKTHFKP